MENKPSTRIHPLYAGAAISAMLVSLTGVAAITGLIPTSHSSTAPTTAAALTSPAIPASAPAASPTSPSLATNLAPSTPSAQVATNDAKADAVTAPLAQSKPAPKPQRSYEQRTAHASTQPRKVSSNSASQPTVAQAPAVCYSCGRVESIQAIKQAAQPSGVGMVAGAVLGGVLGNQIGGGNGRKIATVAGAVGGGYAGNEVEKHTRATTSYQVRVRMEDGDMRTFTFSHQPVWSTGDRVRVVDGQLTSRA